MGALACCGAMLVFAGTANAVVSRDGWGLGIADDDAIGSFAMPPASLTTNRFDLLRPETFRSQIYWDACDDPNSTTDFVDRARKQVERVRAAGVEQVVATFKKHGSQQPTVGQYKIGISRVVTALANEVDLWGPANEPNGGESWLPGAAGAQLLAGYNTALAEIVTQFDPTALRTSPDFIDRCGPDPGNPAACELQSLAGYVGNYLAAGGGWGHYAAIHAYAGVRYRTRATVDDFAALVPAGKDIWITEVGGFGCGQGLNDGPIAGNQRVNWMLNGEPGNAGLASHSRVKRIYHYHMKSGGSCEERGWDTALLNQDLSPRPAWYTWCAAAHGDSPGHPDCAPPLPFQPPALPGLPFAHVNADSRADMVGKDLLTNDVHVALSTGSAFAASSVWTGWANEFQLGDVDGDGQADLVGKHPATNDVHVALSTGGGFATSSVWTTWGSDFQLGDVNGDGRADLVGRHAPTSQVHVALSTGGHFATSVVWTVWYGSAPFRIADANGDGRADITGRVPSTSDVQVGLSSGSGFAASTSWGAWSSDF